MNDQPEVPEHARRPLVDLLDDVAAEVPAPGGGASAAWTTALAAGLVDMAARFTLARGEHAAVHGRMREVSARAAELRARALELAERELHAYEPVLEALKLPREDPSRPERMESALSAAAGPPLEIAGAAAEVSELAAEMVAGGSRLLEGDAVAGLLLAEAACRAAARLVRINLGGREGDPRLDELTSLVERVSAARSSAPSA